MASYTIQRGQNIFDVALTLYGSVEGLFDLLISNEWLDMDTDLKPGQKLEYHDYFSVSQDVLDAMKKYGIVPANGERSVYYKGDLGVPVFLIDIQDSTSSARLAFAGTGIVSVDWGDNSDVETLSLDSCGKCEVEHDYDDVGKKRVKVYDMSDEHKQFELSLFECDAFGAKVMCLRQTKVTEYRCDGVYEPIICVPLMSSVESIALTDCSISDFSMVMGAELTHFDLRGSSYSIKGFDEYLEDVIDRYDSKPACDVFIDRLPDNAGVDMIFDIIRKSNESESEKKWRFIIGENVICDGFPYYLPIKL